MKPDFDLYSDTYYDSLNGTFQNTLNEPLKTYGSMSTFIRGCLVLLLRAGFVLIQLGSIPVENIYVIIIQNVLDLAICITSFGTIGYIVAFGTDTFDGVIGHNTWLGAEATNYDDATSGFCACIIATGIITTVLSGRIHFVGYVLIELIFCLVMQPLIMHWVWHEDGWLHKRNFLDHKVSIKDHAGGLVIHVSAGVVALTGAFFLGRRLLKLSEVDELSIGTESSGSTITGYIFITLGLIGFSLPSPTYELNHSPFDYIGVILVNNFMAMASGIIVVIIIQFLFFREPFNYWILLRCMQGAVAGIVSIASGVDVYSPLIAFLIGTVISVLFYFAMICIYSSSVEDYCNITAIHLICGTLSIISPPLFGNKENLGTSVGAQFRIIHMGWQLLGLLSAILLLVVVFSILFFLLFFTGFLRNKSEEINHRRAATVIARGPQRCCMQRLFALNVEVPYLEPGRHNKIFDENSLYSRNTFTVKPTPETNVKYKKQRVQNTTNLIEDSDLPKVLKINKNQRFIYTVPNTIANPFTETLGDGHFNLLKSSGDTIANYSTELKQKCLEKNQLPSSDFNLNKKHASSYQLHRTEKHTDLLENTSKIVKKA